MKQFWMVWNLNGRAPMFQHDSENSATCEAERLALANPGLTFVVLQAICARKSDTMQRLDLRGIDDEIPF